MAPESSGIADDTAFAPEGLSEWHPQCHLHQGLGSCLRPGSLCSFDDLPTAGGKLGPADDDRRSLRSPQPREPCSCHGHCSALQHLPVTVPMTRPLNDPAPAHGYLHTASDLLQAGLLEHFLRSQQLCLPGDVGSMLSPSPEPLPILCPAPLVLPPPSLWQTQSQFMIYLRSLSTTPKTVNLGPKHKQ